ncbi:MAG: hypothetical protein ACI3YD_03800 [Alloprevotella sp.]
MTEFGISSDWCSKNPTFDVLCRNYGPQHWDMFVNNTLTAYKWVCPPVGALAALYGANCPQAWLLVQMTGIYDLGCRGLSEKQARTTAQYAQLMAKSAAGLKLTEVMQFFARYAVGLYNNEYATLDVTRLGREFHNTYLPARQRELERLLERQAQQAGPSRRGHCVTREEWLATPPDALIGVEMVLLTREGSDEERKVCSFLKLELPLASRRVTAVVQKRQLGQLVDWRFERLLELTDSWREGR